jgi:hypothetical protein
VIAVALGGGIGNQLFQYSAARALAARLGVPLGIDGRRFEGRGWPVYALDRFSIDTAPIDPGALPFREGRVLGRLLSRFGGRFAVYREAGLTFDPAVPFLPDGTYLRGVFASERYFVDQEAVIRRDLAFVNPPDTDNRAVLARISETTAVSVHVRRGDYVTNRRANQVHGTVETDFYRRAADYVAKRSDNDITCFVFSDDPGWAAENLKLGYPMQVVSGNSPEQGVEDLRLMASCRHHILANSTFSWWGAWLNPSADKITVAPTPWFRDPSVDDSTIVPECWISLPASFGAPQPQ